jgi:hypothetical protein
MSWIKGIFLVLLFLPASWTRVSRLNAAIDQAAASYAATEYAQSIKDHRVLLEEFQLVSEYLDFNLGTTMPHNRKKPRQTLIRQAKVSMSGCPPLLLIKVEWCWATNRIMKQR